MLAVRHRTATQRSAATITAATAIVTVIVTVIAFLCAHATKIIKVDHNASYCRIYTVTPTKQRSEQHNAIYEKNEHHTAQAAILAEKWASPQLRAPMKVYERLWHQGCLLAGPPSAHTPLHRTQSTRAARISDGRGCELCGMSRESNRRSLLSST